MSNNDAVILRSVLAESKGDFGANLPDDTYFELFTANEILREFDISYSELEDGNIGGGSDGGLDGMYAFVNGEYITEDFDFSGIGRNPKVDFVVVQAKRTGGFGETALDRATNTLKDVLDLSKTPEGLEDLYDERFAGRAERFRRAITTLAGRHPAVSVLYAYATQGDAENVDTPVEGRAASLADAVQSALRHAEVTVEFLGARELLDLNRTPRNYAVDVEFAEQFISTGADNYVGLVRLTELQRIITSTEGGLRRVIFESNVRDFEGNVEVNRDIIRTLEDTTDTLDFWWLNNGITILGSQATSAGKKVSVSDAQIVNGLQTTHSLHDTVIENEDRFTDDTRCVLVKVIISEDAEARDRIIKATNFQTRVPSASLRATDRLQRNIEDFLKNHGWFYDRRKNYYKNLGKPRERVVSIANLAQALMSIVHRQPDQGRARPSTLIKDEGEYAKLFDERYELQLYLFCVELQRCVDAYLASHPDMYPPATRTNIRFHVSMLYVAVKSNRLPYYYPDVVGMQGTPCDEEVVAKAAALVANALSEFMAETGWSMDRACKSRDFVEFLDAKYRAG